MTNKIKIKFLISSLNKKTKIILVYEVPRGIEPLKKVLTVPRINHSAMTP